MLLVFLPSVRFTIATALFVAGVFPASPLKPLTLVTPSPIARTITHAAAGQEITADLYRPADENKHPGIILYLGANRVGRADARLVNLTDGLARLGFVVLVPDSPDLAEGRITRREVDLLVADVQYFARHPAVQPDRIGLGLFSVGGSIGLLAAADPAIADQIRALNLFGAYFDSLTYAQAISSETIVVDGVEYPWKPDVLPRTIFRRLLIENLPASSDRAALAALVQDPTANPTTALTPGGQAAYALLQRPTRLQAAQLLTALPPETRAILRSLSPSTEIQNVKAQLYVMHDQGDHLIPFTESRALVNAVPASQVHYTELTIFDHVTPRTTAGPLTLLSDATRLFLHLHAFFAELQP